MNCPSKVRTPKGSNLSLKDWITQHPEQLGDPVRKKFGDDLPFLFKVLSVNKSLSVQAHPNKVCIRIDEFLKFSETDRLTDMQRIGYQKQQEIKKKFP